MQPVKVIFIDRQKMFVQGIMALAERIKYPVIKIAGQYSVTKYFWKITVVVLTSL